MKNNTQNTIRFKNAESPFTELFALFQRQDNLSKIGSEKEAAVVNQHLNNAMEILFQGLQSVGQLIGQLQDAESIPKELMNIGYFVSAICNLVEGLNVLRIDINYARKQLN
jgi:hypothetical protein